MMICLILNRCPDVAVCTDGNFSHRHLKKSGNCPDIRAPLERYISAERVHDIRKAYDDAMARPKKKYTGEVPAEALDECEESHESGDSKTAKTSGERYDDTGVMSLVCRHDVPLFFCNIDTPGEGLHYSMTLLLALADHLPENATILFMYDIGCKLFRTLHTVCWHAPTSILTNTCSILESCLNSC